jgi:hypothetical protein
MCHEMSFSMRTFSPLLNFVQMSVPDFGLKSFSSRSLCDMMGMVILLVHLIFLLTITMILV